MNTLTLTVAELKAALTGLSKVLSRRSTLPVLECLRLTRDADGYVTLSTTDLDVWLIYRFPQPITGPVCDVVVPFEPVNRIVRAAKGTVSFLMDRAEVSLRSFIGQSPLDQKLESRPVEEWPVLPSITALPVPLSVEAVKAIREAMEFASEDETRLVLNGVHLDVSNKDAHYVVGTNGRALFSANSFKFALKESVNIPTHKIWLWPGINNLPATLSVETIQDITWLKFGFGDWTFITRAREGNYPNWRMVVPSEHKNSVELNTDAVTAVLLSVPQLPGGEDQNKGVRLRLTASQFLVEAGTTTIPIPGVTIKGSPMVISLNRDYLLICLKLGLTTIQLIDDLSPLVFTKEGKRAVVMPLRTATEEVPPPPQATTEPEPAPTQPQPPEPNPTMSENAAATTSSTAPAPESAIKEALKRVDDLKEDLKQVLRDLQDTYALLRQVEKEKKASEKEVETVREKLRELQNMKI